MFGNKTVVISDASWESKLFTNINELRKQELFCDATVYVAGGDVLRAHSSILAAASPIFSSMLLSSPKAEMCIYLDEISKPAMVLILEFAYTGRVSVEMEELPFIQGVAASLGFSRMSQLAQKIFRHRVCQKNFTCPSVPGRTDGAQETVEYIDVMDTRECNKPHSPSDVPELLNDNNAFHTDGCIVQQEVLPVIESCANDDVSRNAAESRRHIQQMESSSSAFPQEDGSPYLGVWNKVGEGDLSQGDDKNNQNNNYFYEGAPPKKSRNFASDDVCDMLQSTPKMQEQVSIAQMTNLNDSSPVVSPTWSVVSNSVSISEYNYTSDAQGACILNDPPVFRSADSVKIVAEVYDSRNEHYSDQFGG